MSYQNARNTRREARTLVGRFRGGKLAPVMAVAVRGNEGGVVSQRVTLELDPIAGRMITPIYGELISVFVPVQAMDALRDPDGDYAGLTEVLREKLASGNPLFGIEPENEISKRCGVNPRSMNGTKKVSVMVRLAHNSAVNFLRQRKYVKAATVLAGNTAMTPALISQTVLERFNGVLDPDDHINGAVQLDIPDMRLPVHSLEKGSYGSTKVGPSADPNGEPLGAPGDYVWEDRIWTELSGVYAGGVSLSDFYLAQKQDELTRVMRKVVDDNPQYGEEMVLRWAHGLTVDAGKVPFVISEQRKMFGRNIIGATDTAGVQTDVMRSDMALEMSFSVPVPRTELGGVIITFCTLKPDETVASQPHPILSDMWGADNFVADELAIDPVPVRIRELFSDCNPDNENVISMYTGYNALKQTYVHYGLSRELDPETVENKTAVWQLQVPLSVTPNAILYPADLMHYPFADQLAEVCTYVVTSNTVLQTPMIFGPSPVETLAAIDDGDLFAGVDGGGDDNSNSGPGVF